MEKKPCTGILHDVYACISYFILIRNNASSKQSAVLTFCLHRWQPAASRPLLKRASTIARADYLLEPRYSKTNKKCRVPASVRSAGVCPLLIAKQCHQRRRGRPRSQGASKRARRRASPSVGLDADDDGDHDNHDDHEPTGIPKPHVSELPRRVFQIHQRVSTRHAARKFHRLHAAAHSVRRWGTQCAG